MGGLLKSTGATSREELFRLAGRWDAINRFLVVGTTDNASDASGICGAFTAVNMFGSTKLYPWFVQMLGFHGTFWMYGGVMLVEVS